MEYAVLPGHLKITDIQKGIYIALSGLAQTEWTVYTLLSIVAQTDKGVYIVLSIQADKVVYTVLSRLTQIDTHCTVQANTDRQDHLHCAV